MKKKPCGYSPPPLIGQPKKGENTFDVEIAREDIKRVFLECLATRGVGQWKRSQEILDITLYKCSLCGTEVPVQSKYCPDCGAYMESEDKE